jgi:hypothetical protein
VPSDSFGFLLRSAFCEAHRFVSEKSTWAFQQAVWKKKKTTLEEKRRTDESGIILYFQTNEHRMPNTFRPANKKKAQTFK